MSAIRTFIAIHLPDWIQQKLAEVISQICTPPLSAVRWVPSQNIHLTLKFLGDVSPASLNILIDVVNKEVTRHRPFEIKVSGLGAFPSIQRPRVIWVGIFAPQNLLRLQRGIESETNRLGYPPEEKHFSPHLTLGRISTHANPQEIQLISRKLEAVKIGDLGSFQVDNVQVFRSDLNPGGSVYTPLFTANFSTISEKK
jgi:RNA 2',3'-cyclic 3'-phosphodiesterase